MKSPSESNLLPHRAVIILGPTASGKSAFALRLGQELEGHIINADSQQLFQGLPLITAQPSPEEMLLCPHSLYGILPPYERWNAWKWAEKALHQAQAAVLKNEKVIFVGGTGFYISALLHGLSPIPSIPETIVAETEEWVKSYGIEALYERLSQEDKEITQRLKPRDRQRIIRAWTVWMATGTPLSIWHQKPRIKLSDSWEFLCVTLLPENRAHLYARIDARYQAMVQQGAVEEVRHLRGYNNYHLFPAYQAIGVQNLDAYLNDQISLEMAIAQGQLETRHYAKRQITWLKHQVQTHITIDPFQNNFNDAFARITEWFIGDKASFTLR